MKKAILLVGLLISVQAAFGQLAVIENVVKVACKEIQGAKVPVLEMTEDEIVQVFIESRENYLEEWDSTQRVFTQKVLLPFKYDEYFLRRLETECPDFRPAMTFFDDYLVDDERHKLYRKARDLFLALEDGVDNTVLNAFLDRNAPIVSSFWSQVRAEVEAQKKTSTLYIILSDDYTFRCEYRDYITGRKNFEMDLLFLDETDTLINNIRFKTKFTLDQGYDDNQIKYDIDATLPVGTNN